MAGYDALLLLSFGGPDHPDDLLPFLRNVVRGRNVPDERLAEVSVQYEQFGGTSPINEQNRALIDALDTELREAGHELPIWFGNRNWHPFVGDTVAEMADAGVERALVLVTSAFGSYSGCRQYREDLAGAAEPLGDRAPELHKLRLFYNHPGFVDAVTERVAEAHARHDRPARLVFTAHSIPESMAASCDYEHQLRSTAGIVADRVAPGGPWDLVYQSRSGPPQVPWLEPDIVEHLERLADEGTEAVTVVPLGFVSDHQEVRFDLDTQARETAEARGMGWQRAGTVGTHPRFVAGLRELIEEQLERRPALWVGPDGPWPDPCPDGHCLPPRRPGAAGGRPGGPVSGAR